MLSNDEVIAARERLGPVGVWMGSLMGATIEREREVARRIEELGYGSIWTGEIVGGKEAFAHQSVLLAATEHISTGTGIANVWARQPGAMEGGGATLGAAYPGRFVLGIGISHGPIVEMSGQIYAKPLANDGRLPRRHGCVRRPRARMRRAGSPRAGGTAPQNARPGPYARRRRTSVPRTAGAHDAGPRRTRP